MKLIVRPAAAADIEDTYRWYGDRDPDLGAKFLDAVREAGARLKENTEAYPIFYREARRIRLKRFPALCCIDSIPSRSWSLHACMGGETR